MVNRKVIRGTGIVFFVLISGVFLWRNLDTPSFNTSNNMAERDISIQSSDAHIDVPEDVSEEDGVSKLSKECEIAWQDSIYLWGRPSNHTIQKYRKLCDSIRKTNTGYLFYKGMADFNRKVARIDLYNIFLTNSISDSCADIAIWRINEFYPLKLEKGETELDRYRKLQIQIDSLFCDDQETKTQMELNDEIGCECAVDRIIGEFYQERLLSLEMPDIIHEALENESSAWKVYRDATRSFYLENLDYDGSSSTMCFLLYMNAYYKIYLETVLDIYFGLTAHGYTPEKWYQYIPSHLLSQEYRALGKIYKSDTFRAEHDAWTQWMKIRYQTSLILPMNLKIIHDNATNCILRKKLLWMKNRYFDFQIIGPSLLESLLPYDCSYEDLLNFDPSTLDEYLPDSSANFIM